MVADLVDENAQRVAGEITADGGEAVAKHVDVAEAKSALDMAAAINAYAGSIVNQSSTAAWMNAGLLPFEGRNNSLTACLAAELGPMNIRVNAIAPGPTDTEALHTVTPPEYIGMLAAQIAIKRLGTPADLAGTVLFLLSDACPWLTGQIIPVDGGGTVRI